MLSFFKCRYLPIAMLVKNAIRKNIESQPATEAKIILVRVLIKILLTQYYVFHDKTLV